MAKQSRCVRKLTFLLCARWTLLTVCDNMTRGAEPSECAEICAVEAGGCDEGEANCCPGLRCMTRNYPLGPKKKCLRAFLPL